MKSEIKRLIVVLNELADEFSPDIKITDMRIERWDRMLLQKYGIDAIESAATKLIRERKYNGFPRIHDMEEAINGSDGDIEDIALKTLMEVKEAIVEYGAYQSVSFDPIVNKVIERMDGWVNFCNTLEDEWKWREKDFIAAYKVFYGDYKDGTLESPEFLQSLCTNPAHKAIKIKTRYAVPEVKKLEAPADVPRTKNVMEELKERMKK